MTISTPHVLVHEYVSGGGWPESNLPNGLVAEGLAMLRGVLADFRAWGGARITTTRDYRLPNVSLPADHVIELDPLDHYEVLEKLAGQCTAALIIAPESDGILGSLSALMVRKGAHLLGSSPGSVAATADKWACHQLFRKARLPTPETYCVDAKVARKEAAHIGFPLVIKPVDGVSCEGINLVPDVPSLHAVIEKNRYAARRFLLQRYIEGEHASACLLVAGNENLCLSINRQFIAIGQPFNYQGNEVPFTCDKHQEAVAMAKRAATVVPGLKGYIGVDILIAKEKCYLIEINPRLTTSYIGLRSVVNVNLAQAIWEASIRNSLPPKVALQGRVVFRKEHLR
jgi:predicted ATP-grasp superfamily ATP-dependent carboligase